VASVLTFIYVAFVKSLKYWFAPLVLLSLLEEM
jgi:hypothetical protein